MARFGNTFYDVCNIISFFCLAFMFAVSFGMIYVTARGSRIDEFQVRLLEGLAITNGVLFLLQNLFISIGAFTASRKVSAGPSSDRETLLREHNTVQGGDGSATPSSNSFGVVVLIVSIITAILSAGLAVAFVTTIPERNNELTQWLLHSTVFMISFHVFATTASLLNVIMHSNRTAKLRGVNAPGNGAAAFMVALAFFSLICVYAFYMLVFVNSLAGTYDEDSIEQMAIGQMGAGVFLVTAMMLNGITMTLTDLLAIPTTTNMSRYSYHVYDALNIGAFFALALFFAAVFGAIWYGNAARPFSSTVFSCIVTFAFIFFYIHNLLISIGAFLATRKVSAGPSADRETLLQENVQTNTTAPAPSNAFGVVVLIASLITCVIGGVLSAWTGIMAPDIDDIRAYQWLIHASVFFNCLFVFATVASLLNLLLHSTRVGKVRGVASPGNGAPLFMNVLALVAMLLVYASYLLVFINMTSGQIDLVSYQIGVFGTAIFMTTTMMLNGITMVYARAKILFLV